MDRKPVDVPQDEQAERAVLGAMLIEARAAAIAAAELKPQDFLPSRHQLLFEVLSQQHLRRPAEDLDLVSVESEIEARGLTEALGGPNLLRTLIEETPTAANIERYCEIVQERAALRRYHALFSQGLEKIGSGVRPLDLRDWLDRSACELPALTPREWTGLPVWNVADLALEKEMRCVWDGLLARGCVTLLHAPPKTGKTYLLFGLLHAMTNGLGFLGLNAEHTGAVYMTEEGRATLNEKRVRFGLNDQAPVWFISRREREFARMPLKRSLRVAGEWAQQRGAGMIVIDSLGAWSGMQGEEENNAAHTEEVFNLFKAEAAARNVAVLVIHHSQKNGNKARGSSALEAAADVIIRLAEPEDGGNRRTLLAKGRFSATPDRLEFDLTPEGYEVAAEARAGTRAQQLFEFVPGDGEGITAKELSEKIGLQRTRVFELIRELRASGQIEELPRANASVPQRFRKTPSAVHPGQEGGKHRTPPIKDEGCPTAPPALGQATGERRPGDVDPVLKEAWETAFAQEQQHMEHEREQALKKEQAETQKQEAEMRAQEEAAVDGYVDEALEGLMDQNQGL